MKNLKLYFVVFLLGLSLYGIACTNFLVGKDASVDGSTMITYSADSYYLFGALYHYPAAVYPNKTMLDIYDWDSGKYLGKIEQAAQTYNVVGNMNEFAVSIGETTFGGRHELVDTTGILDYGSLIYIALQRSKTAREAIQIMTDLVAKYGYCSEGESFSIADPQEVWIMEMVGKGNKEKGAVWAALRIPDDCVSAHANQARITTIPFNDKENCLHSKDVVSFAKKQGYFSGKDSEFSFSDVYAPLDYGAIRLCEARVWAFFRSVDQQMDTCFSYINGETKQRMPLWIKPKVKLSVKDIRDVMRNHYEGTPLDMTKGAGSGAFSSPFRHSPLTYSVDSIEYYHERPIATQQTGFTFVAQMRNWLPTSIGGVLWFGVDDATCNVYVPMYCGIDSVPECFDAHNGSLLEFSWTSAFWINNWVSNMTYPQFSSMMQDIQPRQQAWEAKFDSTLPAIDAKAGELYRQDKRLAINFLTNYSVTQAQEVTKDWKKLGEYLIVKHLDGILKMEKNGKFITGEKNIPPHVERPGYPEQYLREEFINDNPDRFRIKTKEELNNRR
ncbi:MAG: C69 family dipeptidase [Paludibacteraceae bacterium]|jgi:dipeptidase|nr:C69 family dipeptidase [Paludibacteraceae bacterium]